MALIVRLLVAIVIRYVSFSYMLCLLGLLETCGHQVRGCNAAVYLMGLQETCGLRVRGCVSVVYLAGLLGKYTS